MKKTQNLFYTFLLLLFSNYSYSQEAFHITSISIDNGSIVKEKYNLSYDSEMNSIVILDFNNENGVEFYEYGPVELSNATYEQGLYIEEYNPTMKKLLDKPANEKLHIFKFLLIFIFLFNFKIKYFNSI